MSLSVLRCSRSLLGKGTPRAAARLGDVLTKRASSTASSLHDTEVENSPVSTPDWNSRDDFFRFTRGRFVANEKYEIDQHYVKFDVNKLACIAARAVQAQKCLQVDKCTDGFYNKAFVMTMDNGVKVIAKVPNPNAGNGGRAVASEAATMAFLRIELKLPVPALIAYSPDRDHVGAPYIIMEKIEGLPLDDALPQMDFEMRWNLLRKILEVESTLTSIQFRQYGSLYFAKDLEPQTMKGWLYRNADGENVNDPQYLVGPSVGRTWSDDGRRDLDVDRGPWDTTQQYIEAYAARESDAAQNLKNLLPSPISLYGPNSHIPSRARKMRAAQLFRELAPLLVPGPSICASTLWHSDLHGENIFVDPNDPTKLTGIIDWQSIELTPLFDRPERPSFIVFEGPKPEELRMPDKPDGYDHKDPDIKAAAHSLFLHQCLWVAYEMWVRNQNKRFFDAIQFKKTMSHWFLSVARNISVDGEAILLSELVALKEKWSDNPLNLDPPVPFPLEFTPEEEAKFAEEAQGSRCAMRLMKYVQEELGVRFPVKLWVSHEDYETTKEMLRKVKVAVLKEYATTEEERRIWEDMWPFED